MKPGIKIEITAGTIAAMTTEQFVALRDNVCAEGHWDQLKNEDDRPLASIRVAGSDDYIGVYLPYIFIGIEKDGYTHS